MFSEYIAMHSFKVSRVGCRPLCSKATISNCKQQWINQHLFYYPDVLHCFVGCYCRASWLYNSCLFSTYVRWFLNFNYRGSICLFAVSKSTKLFCHYNSCTSKNRWKCNNDRQDCHIFKWRSIFKVFVNLWYLSIMHVSKDEPKKIV